MLPLPPAARMHAFHCSLHGARYASGLRLVRSASGHAVQACCLSSCHARTLPQRVGEEEETPSHFCLLPCLWPVCCKWRCRGWLAAACWCWASGERIATQTTFITCVHKRLWKVETLERACNATERSVADELARRSSSTSEGGTTIVSVWGPVGTPGAGCMHRLMTRRISGIQPLAAPAGLMSRTYARGPRGTHCPIVSGRT